MFRISLIVGAICCACLSVDAAPLVFRFHPPDSVSFTEEVKTDHTMWDDSTALPTDSSIAVYRRSLDRYHAGFRMTSLASSVITKRGDAVTDNPVNTLLMRTKFVATLDTFGIISTVTGFEHLPQEIDSLYKGELATRLKQSLSPENMAARERSQWNGMLENLAGSTIHPGAITYEQSQYPLPGGGHLPLLIAIRVSDTLRLNGKVCANLLISADSDVSELAERLHLSVDELVVHYPLADTLGIAITQAGSRYVAETRAVLEVATLLPQFQSTQRDIVVVGSTSAGAKTVRLVQGETRTYTYNK